MDVTPDLRIFAVTPAGLDLTVAVYGGPYNACGSVRFSFSDLETRVQHEVLACYWHAMDIPVQVLSDPVKVTLRPMGDRVPGEIVVPVERSQPDVK